MTSPDLTQWAQSRIEALYSSTSEEDVQKSYDTTFSSTPRIFVNHEESAKQSFKDDVVARRTSAASSKVEWKDVMVVPKDEKKPNEAGIVAGSLIVTRSLRFKIRAAPAQMQNHIIFSAKVEQDASIESDADGDRRRIVQMFITSVDKRPPIHFQPVREPDDVEA